MISNDLPIERTEDDEFGVDPFCKAIARAIETMQAPSGTVLALTGPWGIGKSSAVNIVRNHLRSAEQNDELKVVSFNPWWYSDESLLTHAFFQHLYAAIGKRITKNGRRVILGLAKSLLGSGTLVSTAVNFVTFGIGGSVAEKAAAAAADAIAIDRTPEEDFSVLSDELKKQKKRYLIIIDDIDRLTADQALLIFRLVKSVGRLPNVIYLLAFDRDFAERAISSLYPAERHFLEKIVQASFEVPSPDPSVLHEKLLNSVVAIAGHPEGNETVRFRNVLIDVVNPLVSLPRDLVRVVSSLSVVWAAIGHEVNLADLIAIECLRLFKLPVYQAIREHKLLLCGIAERSGERPVALYDELFLSSAQNDRERQYLKTALRRLFPRLDSVWSNTFYSSTGAWQAQRRICDPKHFQSYFRLSLGSDVLPRSVVVELIRRVADQTYIKDFFEQQSAVVRKDGRSNVPLVLEELTAFADQIPKDAIQPFLATIFGIVDRIDIERDQEGGILDFGNDLRLHWLLNSLVRDRLTQEERSRLFKEIVPLASLEWCVSICDMIISDYRAEEGKTLPPLSARLVDEAAASAIKDLLSKRLDDAARSGEILNVRRPLSLLYRWRDLAGSDVVLNYTSARMNDDRFVLGIANAATSKVWTTSLGFDGMGDRVSRGVTVVQLDGLNTILDVDELIRRIEAIDKKDLVANDREIVELFKEGLDNSRKRKEARG